MALDFTDIKDEIGWGLYVVHGGRGPLSRQAKVWARELKDLTEAQIVEVGKNTPNGAKFCSFYGIQSTPVVMIIDDHDQVMHSWYGPHLPKKEHVAHLLNVRI